MTIPAYERDPFLRELEASVTRVEEIDGAMFATTNDTVCYPEGGGQPSDHGTLGPARILDVERIPEGWRHRTDRPVPTGRHRMTVDWDRRFDHMQQHTAQHLITAVAADQMGWATTAFHLGEQTSDIELAAPEIGPEAIRTLEDQVNAAILTDAPVLGRRVTDAEYAALEVRSRGLPDGHAGDIRLVEIEGFDRNTCGGTHVARLGQLGCISLLGTERLRGGTRVFFLAGDRVRARLADHERRTADLRRILDAPDEHLVAESQRREERLRLLTRGLKDLMGELADLEARHLADGAGPRIAAHWENRDMAFLQQVARGLNKRAPRSVAFLTASDGPDGVFLLAAGAGSAVDLQTVGPAVAEVLAGRGGGRERTFQGKASRLDRREEALALL